eukprot:ctg_5642.g479
MLVPAGKAAPGPPVGPRLDGERSAGHTTPDGHHRVHRSHVHLCDAHAARGVPAAAGGRCRQGQRPARTPVCRRTGRVAGGIRDRLHQTTGPSPARRPAARSVQ